MLHKSWKESLEVTVFAYLGLERPWPDRASSAVKPTIARGVSSGAVAMAFALRYKAVSPPYLTLGGDFLCVASSALSARRRSHHS